MKCYLTWCFAGFIALDENCSLLDYELFPRNRTAERLTKILKGDLCKEEKSLLERTVKNYDYISLETNLPRSTYKNLRNSEKLIFQTPNKAGEYLRSNLAYVLEQTGFIETEEEMDQYIWEVSREVTRMGLQEAAEAEDLLLIQSINALDELDETTSKLTERLREWYSIHFPELDKIKNHDLYVKLIADSGDRDSIISSGQLEDDLRIESSIGAQLGDFDISMLIEYAESLKSMQQTKKSLSKYIDNKMEDLAPNLQDLLGASLGAKMIAHVGGIKRLSLLSSGTIQILGAEKALFRHLKTGERPPKHGLIYQHPEVRGAKWWYRGKVARALASKISLSVRKDVFSGDFDPHIKESFYEKLETIKKANPFPKRPAKSAKPDGKKRKKKKKDKYKKKFDLYY
jgi:nucleolar protein 56